MHKIHKAFLQFLLKIKNIKDKHNLKKRQKQLKKVVGNIDETTQKKILGSSNPDKINISTNNTVSKQKEIEVLATKIVKKYYNDTDKTVKILEKKGVKVYRAKKLLKVLQQIKEKPGMILPLKGFSAFYLNFMLGILCEKKLILKNKTNLMFIFAEERIDTFYLAAQVYLFVAYKKHMLGFEPEIQKKYKKIYNRPTNKTFKSLTAAEIYALKEAIARDVEAIDFATKLHDEEVTIQKLNQIKSDNKK
jgi:hypothetical protein